MEAVPEKLAARRSMIPRLWAKIGHVVGRNDLSKAARLSAVVSLSTAILGRAHRIVFYCEGCGKGRAGDFKAGFGNVVKWFEEEVLDAWYK